MADLEPHAVPTDAFIESLLGKTSLKKNLKSNRSHKIEFILKFDIWKQHYPAFVIFYRLLSLFIWVYNKIINFKRVSASINTFLLDILHTLQKEKSIFFHIALWKNSVFCVCRKQLRFQAQPYAWVLSSEYFTYYCLLQMFPMQKDAY